MEQSLILTVMKYCIVAMSLVVAYAEFGQARCLRDTNYAWTKWGLGFMGIYWAFYYTQSIFGGILSAHQIWVRSPLLITLALIAAGAIMSMRRAKL